MPLMNHSLRCMMQQCTLVSNFRELKIIELFRVVIVAEYKVYL